MKKQIIIATLALGAIVFGMNTAQAQNFPINGINGTATAHATKVDINLASVISIDGGNANFGLVEFNYLTTADYQAAQTREVLESLIVSSTGTFDVKVRAEGPNFSSPTNDIAIDVLTIRPINVGGTTTMTGSPDAVVLAETDEILMASNDLGVALVLDLQYEITADKAQSHLFGEEAGTYTQNVVYTATVL